MTYYDTEKATPLTRALHSEPAAWAAYIAGGLGIAVAAGILITFMQWVTR